MKNPLMVLISITFALCACASLREEQLPSEGMIVAKSICPSDGRATVVASQPGKTMSCAMEQTVGSHVRDCVCREGEQPAADRNGTQEMAGQSGASASSRIGGK